MTLIQSPGRRSALVFAVTYCLLSGDHLAAGQRRFGIFGSRNVTYQIFKDAAGRFELEYPTRDWRPLPTGGSVLAILARNDRTATVVVDLARLSEPLAPAEIERNAQIEAESLKVRFPKATEFQSEMLDTKAGRASLIRYARVGTNGPERVLHYSLAVGQDFYRLDGVVSEESRERDEPILRYMLLSFKVPADPSPSKK